MVDVGLKVDDHGALRKDLSKEVKAMIKGLLNPDPNVRWTAQKTAQQPFFARVDSLDEGLAAFAAYYVRRGLSEAGDDEAETKDPHASWAARLIDDGRPKLLEDLTGLACAECHQGVTEEWRRSTHALAWVDPHYQKELRKIRRKKGCTGCHAPEPLAGRPAKGSPRARKDDPHLGVTCTTCHLGADGETIVAFLTDHPDIADLNREVQHRNVT